MTKLIDKDKLLQAFADKEYDIHSFIDDGFSYERVCDIIEEQPVVGIDDYLEVLELKRQISELEDVVASKDAIINELEEQQMIDISEDDLK